MDGASMNCLAPGSSLGPEGGQGRKSKVPMAVGKAQDGRNTVHSGPRASVWSCSCSYLRTDAPQGFFCTSCKALMHAKSLHLCLTL